MPRRSSRPSTPSAPSAAPPADPALDSDHSPDRSPARDPDHSAGDVPSDFGPSSDSEFEFYAPDEGDADDIELDYVSTTLDESADDNSPLAVFQGSPAARNAPGTSVWKWRKGPNVIRRHGFQGTPGIKAQALNASSSVLDIFGEFFTPELWQLMVCETNRYAAQNCRRTGKKMKAWVETTVEELKKYVGVRLLMAINMRPTLEMYWDTNDLFGCPIVKQLFTRGRFFSLTSNLHFADNQNAVPGDRLAKLGRVIGILDDACCRVYTPKQNVSVDESLWPYQGRHHARQYNPSKRARYGMKVYKLCASEGPAAGYTCSFKLYMGADRGELPASTKVVLDLLHDAALLDKGYTVTLDNWYSSPTLYHMLQQRQTHAVGTVRQCRKFMPKDMVVKKRGDVDSRSSRTGMLALAWKDKKVVTMLSTCHDDTSSVTTNRRGVETTKPLVVQDYNKWMGGVDLSDHLAQSYPTPRKTHKWYIKVFFNLLDMSVVNSFAVHKELGGRLTHLGFKKELCQALIGGSPTQPPPRMSRRTRSRSPLRAPATPPPPSSPPCK